MNRSGELTQLRRKFRGADTPEQESKGDYYVSSRVAGTVWKIDSATEKATVPIDGYSPKRTFM